MASLAEMNALIATAIRSADTSYFNENYTKQAHAVLSALEKAGLTILPKSFSEEVWKQTADTMKTGRLKPEEHVKNVYETVLKVVGQTR